MPPKKNDAPEEVEQQEEEEQEPAEPEILKMCFRAGSRLYYGDCKAGYKEKKGTFLRHGSGRQLTSAVAPAGPWAGASCYETVNTGYYDGNWDNDTMTGHGTYQWSDGSSYVGPFVNGQMHGPSGRFSWPDGSAYEGAWHQGTMHGDGRLDSRFDGRCVRGKFHRNCLLKQDGRWVNLLEQIRSEEEHLILDANAGSSNAQSSLLERKDAVRRCACGEVGSSEQQQKSLISTLTSIHSEGLVPLVIADESLAQAISALDCLVDAKALDPTKNCVSIRVASIAKRRKRDYNRMFYTSIQNSLRDGGMFGMVFEDDATGCSEAMNKDANEETWFNRRPDPSSGDSPVPEDWRLAGFFKPNALPCQVFAPQLFNGRCMAKLFCPEVVSQEYATPALPGAAAASTSPPEDEEQRVAADENSSPQAMSLAAAPPVPAGGMGLSGHVFECSAQQPQTVGLKQAYCLRPVVIAQGYLPGDMNKDAARKYVAERLMLHLPLHKMVVVILSTRGEEEGDLSP